VIEIEIYTTTNGKRPFIKWLTKLDSQTRDRVNIALGRLSEGNTANLKSVGDGVFEIKLTFGAGIRIYLGRDGDRLVILLHGGTKHRQSDDITKAKQLWRDYQAEKATERTV